MGTDIVSDKIERIELQKEETNYYNDSFHSRIVLNDVSIFIESKGEGAISSSQLKRHIGLLENRCDILLFITNNSYRPVENFSEKILWTSWADWQQWLKEYPTDDAVLQYLIENFCKLLDSLLLKQNIGENKGSKIRHDNHLYYLTDIDKELLADNSGCDWIESNHKEHIVWKYLSLEHALDMIEEERLYLANPTEWKDPYESYFMQATYSEDSTTKSYAGLFKPSRQLYCTCFTDAFQNDAQWNLYHGEDMAVMIGFDVKKLFDAFSQCHTPLYIGRVNYVEGGWAKARELSDSDKEELKKGNKKAILSLMLRKRINYAYEQEIRLMCLRKYDDKEKKKGTNVPIPGIVDSIVRIRVSPKVGTRTINMIQDYLSDKIPKISRSRLFAKIAKKKEIDLNTNKDGQNE